MNDKIERSVKEVLHKLGEIDDVITGINHDLLEMKTELKDEQRNLLSQALSVLGTGQRSMHHVVENIQKMVDAEEDQSKEAAANFDEEAGQQVNELLAVAPILVEFGYSRDMSAPPEQFWYAHRDGHQIRTSPSGNKGMEWTYFPPKLIGETSRGVGMESLQDQLSHAHRREQRQQTDEALGTIKRPGTARSAEAQDAFETPFKDFVIIQTQTNPVERYEVREADHEYPRYIARFPETGEWKDYTAEATGSGAPPPRGTPSKYIDIVRFWINRGRPVMKAGGEPSDARASGVVPSSSKAVNAVGVASMAGEGGYERSPSGAGDAPVAGMPDRR